MPAEASAIHRRFVAEEAETGEEAQFGAGDRAGGAVIDIQVEQAAGWPGRLQADAPGFGRSWRQGAAEQGKRPEPVAAGHQIPQGAEKGGQLQQGQAKESNDSGAHLRPPGNVQGEADGGRETRAQGDQEQLVTPVAGGQQLIR